MRKSVVVGLGVGTAALLLVAACQPVDEAGPADSEPADSASTVSEGEGVIAAIAAAVEPVALEWDRDARMVELVAKLDDDQTWKEASASYVAPDADRLLVVRHGPQGTIEEEHTLETLGFRVLPEEALRDFPAFPADAAEPAEVVEGAEEGLGACDVDGQVVEVRYASGAPGAWDGTAWAPDPRWSIAAHADDGGVLLGLDGHVAEDPCFSIP